MTPLARLPRLEGEAMTLTDAERESLADACDAAYDFGDTWIRFLRNGDESMLLPAVEGIIAARETALREEIAAAVRVVGGLIAERDALAAKIARHAPASTPSASRAIERLARHSGPGYLERIWVEANGNWMCPREDEMRAFLAALSREVEQ